MLSERFSKLTATIRFRLMLWMIVTVAVLLAVAMLGVRQIYRKRLLADFDRTLYADVESVTRELRQSYPDWRRFEQSITQIALAHPLQSWFVEVFDERGRQVAAGAFKRFDPPLPILVVTDTSPSQQEMLPYRLIVARVSEPALPTHPLCADRGQSPVAR